MSCCQVIVGSVESLAVVEHVLPGHCGKRFNANVKAAFVNKKIRSVVRSHFIVGSSRRLSTEGNVESRHFVCDVLEVFGAGDRFQYFQVFRPGN